MARDASVIGMGIAALPLLFACSGRIERDPNAQTIVHDAGLATDTGAGAQREHLDAPPPLIDARDFYCNVPEPGPCCCDPILQELRAPANHAGFSCEFELMRSRMPFRADHINLTARQRDGSERVLFHASECGPDASSWMYATKEPPVVRLCSSTCAALLSGEYESIRVIQGCYTIACPPP